MADRRNANFRTLFNPVSNEPVGTEARYLLSNSALVPDPGAVCCWGVIVYGSRPESILRAGGGARSFLQLQNSVGTTLIHINQQTGDQIQVLYGATAVAVSTFVARDESKLIHFWATRQADGLRIYRNGVLISGPTAAAAIATSGDDIAINGNAGGASATPIGYDILSAYISEDSAPDTAPGTAAAWQAMIEEDYREGRGLARLWRTPVVNSDYIWDAGDIVDGPGVPDLTWTDRVSGLAIVRQSTTQPVGGRAIARF